MNLQARALYDNVAEAPNELSFKRNDILTVMQQDIKSLPGWWLCSIGGRIGIAPGNRLELIVIIQNNNELATYDEPPPTYQVPPLIQQPKTIDNLYLASSDETYSIPPPSQLKLNPVIKDSGYYSNRSSSISNTFLIRGSAMVLGDSRGDSKDSLLTGSNTSDSDTPDYLDAVHIINNSTKKCNDKNSPLNAPSLQNLSLQEHTYLNINNLDFDQTYKEPPLICSKQVNAAFNPSQTNSSSFYIAVYDDVNEALYPKDYTDDVNKYKPEIRQHSDKSAALSDSKSSLEILDFSKTFTSSNVLPKPSDLECAELGNSTRNNKQCLDIFIQLHDSLEQASNALFKFIANRWKTVEYLLVNLHPISSACNLVYSIVNDFLKASVDILGITIDQCSDKAMQKKLWQHIKPLKTYTNEFNNAMDNLKNTEWNAQRIVELSSNTNTDYLSILILSLQNININAHSLMVVVKANSTIIFVYDIFTSDNSPATLNKVPSVSSSEDLYTFNFYAQPKNSSSVSSLDAALKQYSDSACGISFRNCDSQHLTIALSWYAAQLSSSVNLCSATIVDFIKILQSDQLPNVFLQHSKYVVLSGQKVIYTADVMCRSIQNEPQLAKQIIQLTNDLCQMLKLLVTVTKSSVLQYPDTSCKPSILSELKKIFVQIKMLNSIALNYMTSQY